MGEDHFIPFHFSRRYEKVPEILYQEITAACSRAVLPVRAQEISCPHDLNAPFLPEIKTAGFQPVIFSTASAIDAW